MRPFSGVGFAGVACAITMTVAGLLWAAPGRDIRSTALTPSNGNTGPASDPHASRGQWFRDGEGVERVREYELYDNAGLYGGSPADPGDIFHDSGSIRGYVTDLVWAGAAYSSNIVGFGLKVQVTNDMPGQAPGTPTPPPFPASPGSNDHGESTQTSTVAWAGTLHDAILAVEFAYPDVNSTPGDRSTVPYIAASSWDLLAWYCYTPGSGKTPEGSYQVPAFELGNINPNQTSERTLSFSVTGPGFSISTAPGSALMSSFFSQIDLLSNRSNSLKISQYVESGLLNFDFINNPTPTILSNVSVFFDIPEPGGLALLGIGGATIGLVVLRRRRRG